MPIKPPFDIRDLTRPEWRKWFTNVVVGEQIADAVLGSASIKRTDNGDGTITLSLNPADYGDITVTGTFGNSWTIDNGVVTLAKQANLAANTIQGNNTGLAAVPKALTVSEILTMLSLSSSDSPAFAGLTLSGLSASLPVATGAAKQLISATITGTGNIVMDNAPTIVSPTINTSLIIQDGAWVGQSAGPKATFDDTNNFLEITGCNVGINTATPTNDKLHIVTDGFDGTYGKGILVQSLTGAAGIGPAIQLKNDDAGNWVIFARDGVTYKSLSFWDAVSGVYCMELTGTSFFLGSDVVCYANYAGYEELPPGGFFGSIGNKGFSFIPGAASPTGGVNERFVIAYYSVSGSHYYSAVETCNVASGYSNVLILKSGGNVGIGQTTFDGTGNKVLIIGNGTAPAAHVDNAIQIYSVDSGDAAATLGLMLEQAVEDIGTFTATHKIKVKINGTEYYWALDAV